jgi:hypothetical protein
MIMVSNRYFVRTTNEHGADVVHVYAGRDEHEALVAHSKNRFAAAYKDNPATAHYRSNDH